MSRISPTNIYKDFENNKLERSKASELLISLIENPSDISNKNRILAVKFLGIIGSKEEQIFSSLENLLISDLDELVRGNAARVIIRNFSTRALEPIKWALKHENSESSLILIINALETTKALKLKGLLEGIEFVEFEGNVFFPYGSNSTLNLSSNSIDDIPNIKRLGNLHNLNKLYLNFNRITEIRGLGNLIDLKSLHLQGNKIRTIEGLENLKDLEYLYLNNNEIHKIQGTSNLSKLKSLMLYDNQIVEIEKLDHLSNLEILNLRNNKINSIKGLEKLHNLKRLDLSNNSIAEINGLNNLRNLEFLDLSHNQISQIRGLDNLRNLKFLDLRNNKITTIKQFKILKQLQHLYLGFNKLLKIEDNENPNQKNMLNMSKIEDNDNIDSLFDFFYVKNPPKNLIDKKLVEIKDIKYLNPKLKSQFLVKELRAIVDPIDYFAASSWMIFHNNSEFEIFQLNKSGEVVWIQKRRSRIMPNQI
ncbi:MAG: leucine-rich repeat protein [Promethearchaeota archaeon]|jgi:Leucine-rich repeat (LRR) protein